MGNCFFKRLKSSVNNQSADFYNSVKFDVLDAEKALSANIEVDFYGNSGLVGFTISNSSIDTITSDRMFVRGKNSLYCCKLNLKFASRESIQLDLNSVEGSTELRRFMFQYIKFKGSLVDAIKNNSSMQYIDFGACNFDAVTDNFDSNGVIMGNLLGNFPGLYSINCNVKNYELLPFVNAARNAGRIPTTKALSLNLMYGSHYALINGVAQTSQVNYIMWTSDTISTYKSDGTLIDTYHV